MKGCVNQMKYNIHSDKIKVNKNIENYIIKNGIAYSGNKAEQGSIVEKLNHSFQNNIEYIQIRIRDIQDYIFDSNKSLNEEKLLHLSAHISQFKGEISLHLPNPVWNYETNQLEQKNAIIIDTIKNLLLPLGIRKYTIHPHFNRIFFNNLNQVQKETVLNKMANYFAQIAQTGATIAIENIPTRNISEILKTLDSPKKRKGIKNISYGMTISEIEKILYLTKSNLQRITNKLQEDIENVGITYDTGHSLIGIDNFEQAYTEMEKWISHFNKDIKIIHLTPNVRNKSKTDLIIRNIYHLCKAQNIEPLLLIESHNDLDQMTYFYIQSEQIKNEIYKDNIL